MEFQYRIYKIAANPCQSLLFPKTPTTPNIRPALSSNKQIKIKKGQSLFQQYENKMGMKVCCMQNPNLSLQQPPIIIQEQPIIETIENYLKVHPKIEQVLHKNTHLHSKYIKYKTQLRHYHKYIVEDGVYIADGMPQGERNGYGIMLYADGQYYEGQWKDGLRWGTGFLVEEQTGGFYSGDWEGDLAHGVGVYLCEKPYNMYDGHWMQGTKNGQATQNYQDGSLYTGNFLNGKKHGSGKLTYSNGTVYQGQFLKDTIQGTGIFKGRKHTYQGEWKNGVMHGAGRSQWRNSDNQVIGRYLGQYREGIKEGFGEYTDSKGIIYKAIWKNGEVSLKGPVLTEQILKHALTL